MTKLADNLRNARTTCIVVAVAAAFALSGCRAKELGLQVSPTTAKSVDHTWIIAAHRCWPALVDTTDKIIDAALADPIRFRSAFPVYGTLTDADVESIAALPVIKAPFPDLSVLRNPTTPIITRIEASNTAAAPDAPTSQSLLTHRDAVTIPDDALCAVHAGTPVGFK